MTDDKTLDQDNWNALQFHDQPVDQKLLRLHRIEQLAKAVVDAHDRQDAEGVAVAMEGLGMVIRE